VLFRSASPGLTILPFHRLVALAAGTGAADVLGRLAAIGDLKPWPSTGDRLADMTRLLEEMAGARGRRGHRHR
jgi:hypothetical protein